VTDQTPPQTESESTEDVTASTDTPPTETAAPTDEDTPSEAPAVEQDVDEVVRKAMAEAQKNLEGWQRERAEFANYKKRVERERLDTYDNAMLDVMKAVLPIVEDFERSVENVPDDIKDNAWVEGTVAIARKFQRLLERFEIEPIDPLGEPFNPDEHQAIQTEPSDEYESNTVSATLQKGYRKGDKLIRQAVVKVAS
jgi:molecular chaperone GrpE